MASPSILRQSKNNSLSGFILMEVLIATLIALVFFGLALFISFDFYRNYAFLSEKDVIVSVLQKARSQSLNNINQTRHGVRFEQNSSLKYIIFECPSVNPNCNDYVSSSNDIVINASYGITVANPSLPFDVIFNQLSGDCVSLNCSATPLSITISDNIKSYTIYINNEGMISW